MEASVQPFLMFEGKAEEALSFYVSLIPNSEITSISATARRGRAPRAR